MSPLMAACTYGHLKIVKLLLNLGANVSRIFGLYRSPLGAALEANRKEENICILLIERGADVRVVDGLDRSYMHIAATYDLPNVIGVLAARGADVNARDKHLDTPLHNAVQRKNHRAMEALLEVKGIDVRAKNRLDYTALHLASKDGCSRSSSDRW
ncbi:ankyrin repeat domain-containing protein 2-like [Pomacea canaliculata]|uniref:ankyrin repeat domain-containing protein 2-like n=1 Tax=Pomacea canaliculata TaxID=400727 RepID=UPI000D72A07E|nr:ankyrin repeat domain-containing protein 2-like [Pomacea canaliculata]